MMLKVNFVSWWNKFMAWNLNEPKYLIKLAIPSLEKLMYFRTKFWKKCSPERDPRRYHGLQNQKVVEEEKEIKLMEMKPTVFTLSRKDIFSEA